MKRTSLTIAAASLLFLSTGCPSGKPAAVLATSDSWCPDGFEGGPQDTCFAVPEMTTRETPVLVYLHGPYKDHGSSEEWALVRSAIDRGFAVMVPRGRRGLCAWTAELKDHFCWPQDPEDPAAFKQIVEQWEQALWQVDAIMEGPPHRKYVLGLSNGGSFASYLATHGVFAAKGWALVNAGPIGAVQKPPSAAPVLLVAAQGDTTHAAEVQKLHDGLGKASWAHGYCQRPGDTALASADIEAALAFFKHDADGTLKPSGNTYPCDGGLAPAGGAGPAPAADPAKK